MKCELVPFNYRDFYDLPRSVIFQKSSYVYFLECLFNDTLDEYEDFYTVYQLDVEHLDLDTLVSDSDWLGYSKIGKAIGKIRVTDVRFDETKRESLDVSFLDYLG